MDKRKQHQLERKKIRYEREQAERKEKRDKRNNNEGFHLRSENKICLGCQTPMPNQFGRYCSQCQDNIKKDWRINDEICCLCNPSSQKLRRAQQEIFRLKDQKLIFVCHKHHKLISLENREKEGNHGES